MKTRVYECEGAKKAALTKILEADPYSEGSFARVGYKVKDGGMLGEDKAKMYVYVNASDDFVKKADELLKDVAKPCEPEVEKRIAEKIQKEEEDAEGGLGSIFG
ncbi:hypothetical protein L0Y65_02420 [Candidatus Micrarchaeota archaeon]|nr:hypothetical protein [Candidatus Micrarchaeota archaeon]